MFHDCDTLEDRILEVRDVLWNLVQDAKREMAESWDAQDRLRYEGWENTGEAYSLAISLIDVALDPPVEPCPEPDSAV